MDHIEQYLNEVKDTLDMLPLERIREVVDVLLSANRRGSTIFPVGNGGSAATASHMACDLAKGTISRDHPRFRVVALTDNIPLMTAWSNDVSYQDLFAEQLSNLIRKDDVVIAISGSGNSPNVLRAVELARERGGYTIGFSGFDGGKLAQLVDLPVVVPSNSMEQIEDLHLVLSHLIATGLRQQMRQADSVVSMDREMTGAR